MYNTDKPKTYGKANISEDISIAMSFTHVLDCFNIVKAFSTSMRLAFAFATKLCDKL